MDIALGSSCPKKLKTSLSANRFLAFPVALAACLLLGSAPQVKAQVDQTTFDNITVPIDPSPGTVPAAGGAPAKVDATPYSASDLKNTIAIYTLLKKYGYIKKETKEVDPAELLDIIKEGWDAFNRYVEHSTWTLDAIKKEIPESCRLVIENYENNQVERELKRIPLGDTIRIYSGKEGKARGAQWQESIKNCSIPAPERQKKAAVEETPPDFRLLRKTASGSNISKQPLQIKVTGILNPGWDDNPRHVHVNPIEDRPLNLGVMAQVTSGVSDSRPYDIIGASVQTTSLRYENYVNAVKLNSDVLVYQGVYQFLLNGFYFERSGELQIINPTNAEANRNAPATSLMTYQTLLLALVDQQGFIPYFEKQNTNLFTPQVQYSIQNIPLAGVGDFNRCTGAPKTGITFNPGAEKGFDPSGAYCLSLKLTANFGQTFATVTPVNSNLNYSLYATPTIRLSGTNFALSFPNSYGERFYENVVGGRHDQIWQNGVTPQYTFEIPTTTDKVSLSLSAPVNYTQYHSSIIKALSELCVGFCRNRRASWVF